MNQLDTGDLLKGDLLNVDVNVDLDADLAAPINGAVAANANVAAPIDASVAVNILSENSEATALAQQDAIITQTITGSAEATSDQTSDINQASVEPVDTDTASADDDEPVAVAPAPVAAPWPRPRLRRSRCRTPRRRSPSPWLLTPRPDRRHRRQRLAVTILVDAPTRADGVQLLGETVGSGYRTPPALVRRSDGQVIQLTPLLYLVLSATDGRRSAAEIAEAVSHTLRRGVSEEVVTSMVDGHLRPLGLLKRADGSDPEVRRSDPLLGLKLRKVITDPRTTHRLTDPFRCALPPGRDARRSSSGSSPWCPGSSSSGGWAPRRTTPSTGRTCCCSSSSSRSLSGGFHEFGHAAAARYGGAEPGAMGAGLYLVWPAFYTDVTDSYRLGRGGRIRTDLGGLYFNAIVVVVTFVWWWSTGWDALLLLVATQVLQMAQQLLPLLRFDGYHVLADVAGVPDLYQRIRPTLVGLLPHKWRSPENRMIKPWSRAVITLWVFITVPMMLLMLFALVSSVPRVVGSAGAVVGEDVEAVARAFESGGAVDVVAHVLQVLGVVLPMVAGALILGRVGLRFFGGLARWGRGSLPAPGDRDVHGGRRRHAC